MSSAGSLPLSSCAARSRSCRRRIFPAALYYQKLKLVPKTEKDFVHIHLLGITSMTTIPVNEWFSIWQVALQFPITSSQEFMWSNLALNPLLNASRKHCSLGICLDRIRPSMNNVGSWQLCCLLRTINSNNGGVSYVWVRQKHTLQFCRRHLETLEDQACRIPSVKE